MAGAIEATLHDYRTQDHLGATGLHKVGNALEPHATRLNV